MTGCSAKSNGEGQLCNKVGSVVGIRMRTRTDVLDVSTAFYVVAFISGMQSNILGIAWNVRNLLTAQLEEDPPPKMT